MDMDGKIRRPSLYTAKSLNLQSLHSKIQSACSTHEHSSPGSVQEDRPIQMAFEASPSGRDMEVEEVNEIESESGPFNDSDDPSTTSSEIRRRQGPQSEPRFILANNSWLGRVGTDLRHFSSAMTMPGKDDTTLSAPSGYFAVSRLALEVGLRFYYCIDHNQLAPNSWQNILTFLVVCELKGIPPSLLIFT